MKKTHKINISDFKDLHIKEAFEYFATYDFDKLNYVSNTKNISLIRNTLMIRNVNANKIRGYIFYENNTFKNVVGYIENIKCVKDEISFDLIYMNTNKGLEFYKKSHVGFDIILSNLKIELNTNGSYVNGATLKTDNKSVKIIYFYIHDKKSNTLKLFKP